jgi:hypothetical protein
MKHLMNFLATCKAGNICASGNTWITKTKISWYILIIATLLGCDNHTKQAPPASPLPQAGTADVPATTATPATAESNEGLRVKVVKMIGDFTLSPPTGQRLPELAPVHVFRGRVQPFETPDPKHPALIKIVQPDKDGGFEIPLPPGEYTLVLDIKGWLYLNNWLDDGSWAITVVQPHQWTDYTIENVLEAYF